MNIFPIVVVAGAAFGAPDLNVEGDEVHAVGNARITLLAETGYGLWRPDRTRETVGDYRGPETRLSLHLLETEERTVAFVGSVGLVTSQFVSASRWNSDALGDFKKLRRDGVFVTYGLSWGVNANNARVVVPVMVEGGAGFTSGTLPIAATSNSELTLLGNADMRSWYAVGLTTGVDVYLNRKSRVAIGLRLRGQSLNMAGTTPDRPFRDGGNLFGTGTGGFSYQF